MTDVGCPHLRVEYEEPHGKTSKGRCLDCGVFVKALPNSMPVIGWAGMRTKKTQRNAAKNRWPKRGKKDA